LPGSLRSALTGNRQQPVQENTSEATAMGSMIGYGTASLQTIVPAAATCQGRQNFRFSKRAQLELKRA